MLLSHEGDWLGQNPTDQQPNKLTNQTVSQPNIQTVLLVCESVNYMYQSIDQWISLTQEEKKSFKEKLHAAQEICLQVQEGLDVVASLGERVKK